MSVTAGVYKNGGRGLSDKENNKIKGSKQTKSCHIGKFGFFFLDYNPGQARKKKSETVLMTSNQVLGQVLSLHLIGHGKS